MYLVFVVAQMQPGLDGLAHLVRVYYLQHDDRSSPRACSSFGEVGLLALLAVVGWLAGLIAFRRRDLAA